MQESRNSSQPAEPRRSLTAVASGHAWTVDDRNVPDKDSADWSRFTASDLYTLRKRLLKFTRQQLANLIGVSPSTVSKWEREESPISPTAARLLMLIALMGPSAVRAFQSPEEYKCLARQWQALNNKAEDIREDEAQTEARLSSDVPDDFDSLTVKALRQDLLHWTQAKFADRIGVTKSAISRWESASNKKGAQNRSCPDKSHILLLKQLWREAKATGRKNAPI